MRKPPLAKSFAEINRAKQCLLRLKAATSFAESEEAWKDGVEAIEKSWEKAKAEFKGVVAFSGWVSPHAKTRNSDLLLVFVAQARHADAHTIEDSVKLNPGGVGVGPVEPKGTVRIREFVFRDGRIERLVTDGPVRIVSRGPHPELCSFVNRGVTYHPPTTHKDQPVSGKNPVVVLAAAIDFYESYLQELRAAELA